MMDILRKARRLEHAIAQKLDGLTQRLTQSEQREPLAVMLAIVDEVEQDTQQAGRGKRVFPFNRITASVAAGTAGQRARFEAVFDGDPSLEQRIVERLQSAGCDVRGIGVDTTYVAAADATWTNPRFHIELARVPGVGDARHSVTVPARIELRVVHGTAEREDYSFSLERIDIGRCVEVRDSRHRLLRTNHVAFVDGSGSPNRSVSRRHAYVACSESGVYRLFDERSAHGTSVLRNGRTITVPPGSRGIVLESDDQIVLGDARLAVKIHNDRRG
jgi:hypothetical protein